MKHSTIAKFFYEVGNLKQKRTGWGRMWVTNPESVADHSLRTAIIGYTLATLEGVNAERTACLCLFHDLSETRIGDLSWIAKRYIKEKEGERRAAHEQVAHLPQELRERIRSLIDEYEAEASLEAQLAHEADLLECLLQSREYAMQGYVKGEEWARICRDGLKTDTAKALADACLSGDPGEWFQEIQRNPRLL